MINFTEILITVLISISINTIEKKLEPKKYELYFHDGTYSLISINKSQKYFCPKYCTVKHYHKTSTTSSYDINNYNLISSQENSQNNLTLNGRMVNIIYLINETKDKNSGIIHSDKRKMEIYKFLEENYK